MLVHIEFLPLQTIQNSSFLKYRTTILSKWAFSSYLWFFKTCMIKGLLSMLIYNWEILLRWATLPMGILLYLLQYCKSFIWNVITELSEYNEKRKGSNKIPIEEDKWKELSKKSSEELEQGTCTYKQGSSSICSHDDGSCFLCSGYAQL